MVALADESQRPQLIASWDKARTAQSLAETNPLANIASIVKWGALAIGAFMVWKALAKR